MSSDVPSLQELARKFGSDKGETHFCPIYERYLASRRQDRLRLLEIGVGGYDDPNAGGASIRMWKSYFPNAAIHAIDFYDKSAHAADRIEIHRGSQDDPAFLSAVIEKMGGADIIVDDGSHVSLHVIKSFEMLFPAVSAGGLYVVEDVATSYFDEYGGTMDFVGGSTSMNYFKRLTDGINHAYFRTPYFPTFAERHAAFVHFYPNLVIVGKR